MSRFELSSLLRNENMRTSEIIRRVENKIGDETLQVINEAVVVNLKQLWGYDKPASFEKDQILLTVYKDLFGLSFRDVVNNINIGYQITEHSFKHNVPIVREALSNWANGEIRVGNLAEWKEAASKTRFGNRVADANLWMDSSDYPIVGKSSTSRKSPQWSYKLNGVGRRYMALSNAHGHVLKLWGGYSPKVYDGDFITANKEYIESTFEGGVVLADNHFRSAGRGFKKVKYYTNIARRQLGQKRSRNSEVVEEGTGPLTREEEAFNREHQVARARVESPFGWMKTKFQALHKPWWENEEQLDYLIKYATAILNYKRNI